MEARNSIPSYYMKIDIIIQYDDRMNESPKILKDYKVYYTNIGGLATRYLIEQLKL
jgi:hypothetical protein